VTFSPALLSPKFLLLYVFFIFNLILLFSSISFYFVLSIFSDLDPHGSEADYFLFCFGYSRLEQKISMSKSAIKLMREDQETFNKLMVDKEDRLNNKIHSIILLKACLISQ
jgi:hypothetical protein